MQNEPKMAIETSRELFQILVNAGVNSRQLLERSQIKDGDLDKSECRFPVKRHLMLWQAGESLLPLRAIALKMGARSDPYRRGIVGLVFAASPDLQSAIDNKICYTKILADHISLKQLNQNDTFAIHYSILDGYFHRYEIERVFAGFLNWVRTFTQSKVSPVRLSFQYARPEYAECYSSHFECPIHFDQPYNSIELPAEILGYKSPQYNDYLYHILKSRADDVLDTLDTSIDFINNVKSMIAGRLCHGNFLAEDIAESLNISKRTLNRKLTERDLTYQKLLDSIRKDMAVSYLSQGDCSIQNLPFLLGYSDPRGFNRAFKRWMGCSPTQYMQTS